MKPVEVSNGIYQLSVAVEDILFEGIWEIPKGVTVNSYIVKGEKTAIIDGVCGWDGVPETLIKMLNDIDINPKDIDYLVINHMEPDHSGWIEDFKKIREDFKIVCTQKAAALLEHFYQHEENITVVKDGDSLDLGNGRVLEFSEVPNVHWPETMMTFDVQSKTLFPCDLFGTFGIFEGHTFDDRFNVDEHPFFEEEGLRYFSNVMATFSSQVKKAVEKTEALPVEVIAPGHGLIWRKNIQTIIDAYKRYIDYSLHYGKKDEVMILWGSMYGMTEKAVYHVEKYLTDKGLTVHSHRVPETSLGQVLTSALASATIIVAAPTYEYNMFPPVAAALEEIGRKRISHRLSYCFGSHGWAPGTVKELKDIMERTRMKWKLVESFQFKGEANQEDYSRIEANLDSLIEEINAL